jgi:hypothetical protein
MSLLQAIAALFARDHEHLLAGLTQVGQAAINRRAPGAHMAAVRAARKRRLQRRAKGRA